MADNITLNSGTGGADLATDDIGGKHHQRVKVSLGADGAGADLALSNPMPLLDRFAIARGEETTYAHKRVIGFNADIDTAAEEDVWTAGGVQTPPIAAGRLHDIVSTDANDTSAGTGARTVLVEGLDAAGAAQSETITLNGITNVPTVNTYSWIQKLTVKTAGSGGVNAGAITATAQTEATVSAHMAIGRNVSENSHYEVPASRTVYILGWAASIGKALTTGAADATFWVKDSTGLWVPKLTRGIITGGFDVELKAPLKLAAGDQCKVKAAVGADNTSVWAGYELVEVT